jgi:hypothetical protein
LSPWIGLGTRMPVSAIVDNFDYGLSVAEICEQFELCVGHNGRCQVRTFMQTGWPVQLTNGQLLKSAEDAGFDVMVTSDQNVCCRQNLVGRRIGP